jgi:hypothetical protein
MFKLDEKVLNVAGHTDPTPAGCIVPFDVNIRNFLPAMLNWTSLNLLRTLQ